MPIQSRVDDNDIQAKANAFRMRLLKQASDEAELTRLKNDFAKAHEFDFAGISSLDNLLDTAFHLGVLSVTRQMDT